MQLEPCKGKKHLQDNTVATLSSIQKVNLKNKYHGDELHQKDQLQVKGKEKAVGRVKVTIKGIEVMKRQ